MPSANMLPRHCSNPLLSCGPSPVRWMSSSPRKDTTTPPTAGAAFGESPGAAPARVIRSRSLPADPSLCAAAARNKRYLRAT